MRPLWDDFVIATRAGHPFADDPTLERYCATPQMVVSLTGDTVCFVDEVLAKHGVSRRIALTAPNFMMALSLVAETDMVVAMPRRFMAMHARRFGVIGTEPPLKLPHFRIRPIAPKVAMMDAGLAWLVETMRETVRSTMPVATAQGARTSTRPRSRPRRPCSFPPPGRAPGPA